MKCFQLKEPLAITGKFSAKLDLEIHARDSLIYCFGLIISLSFNWKSQYINKIDYASEIYWFLLQDKRRIWITFVHLIRFWPEQLVFFLYFMKIIQGSGKELNLLEFAHDSQPTKTVSKNIYINCLLTFQTTNLF